ncbi:ABC transporter permease [Paenibacillus harenae]|uniref:ABC-2 type transport system permease protein n=1 Tax=Paenibacillus harenae TaxID=306543 RepID=A0ABT9U2R0_PAEHA|nr:ABC-2 family transporter protein [Paenibacillus harenae]MDQ0062824.1 ABC-2 type transport system permease protein [Paenibacillus harenae]MDQ0113916.1 ABC-2 type transport system permease protein [Paenibacillus harenae]
MRGIALCLAAVMRTKLAEQMAYRSHFALSVLLLVIGDLVVPFVTLLVYNAGASFPGWTLHEALLVQAVFTLAKGIAFPFFFGMVGTTLSQVREGTFDLLLLRPRPVMMMAILTGFDPDDFGRLISGSVLFGVALSGLSIPSGFAWLQFVLLFIASIAILCAVSLFLSGMLFRWVGSSRVFDIFDAVTRFGMYPGTIYSKSVQNLLTYVLPVGLIAFVPATALLGRSGWGTLWALLPAAGILLLGGLFWNRMLRGYTSAGG